MGKDLAHGSRSIRFACRWQRSVHSGGASGGPTRSPAAPEPLRSESLQGSHSSRTTPTDRVGTVNADDFASLAEVHETRLFPRVVGLVAEWARL